MAFRIPNFSGLVMGVGGRDMEADILNCKNTIIRLRRIQAFRGGGQLVSQSQSIYRILIRWGGGNISWLVMDVCFGSKMLHPEIKLIVIIRRRQSQSLRLL